MLTSLVIYLCLVSGIMQYSAKVYATNKRKCKVVVLVKANFTLKYFISLNELCGLKYIIELFWKKDLVICICGAATLNERIIRNERSRFCYRNLRSFCIIETESVSCNSLIVMHLLEFLSAPYLWFQIIKPHWIPEKITASTKKFHVKDIWSLWYTLEAF